MLRSVQQRKTGMGLPVVKMQSAVFEFCTRDLQGSPQKSSHGGLSETGKGLGMSQVRREPFLGGAAVQFPSDAILVIGDERVVQFACREVQPRSAAPEPVGSFLNFGDLGGRNSGTFAKVQPISSRTRQQLEYPPGTMQISQRARAFFQIRLNRV